MIRHTPTQTHENLRRGFTLVEMLVTVAVVSLMMVLFAEIFSLASSSVGSQKGIARNDQRARVVLNMLRNDLDSRTMVSVLPFAQNENPPTSITTTDEKARDFAKRRGYFYISENDPAIGTDDVLQFVVQFEPAVDEGGPYFGKADNFTANPPGSRNVPDFDDGSDDGGDANFTTGANPSGSGSSNYAVVSYFLRHGTLYRRVMLVRDPLDVGDPAQPAGTAPTLFWRNLDYSAHYSSTNNRLTWHGGPDSDADWLDNAVAGPDEALADPRTRFGHDHITGRPREYDSSGNFFGRLTLQETSHSTFAYPASIAGGGPFTAAKALTLSNGVITQYGDESARRGEDTLMQNVHEFDIKVFDQTAGEFVDIGTGTGDYAAANRRNGTYGPSNGSFRNIFDTWHPDFAADPPFRPATGNGGDGNPGTADDTGVKPLRAIQIRLRFYDRESDQLRQLTIRHALTDRSS